MVVCIIVSVMQVIQTWQIEIIFMVLYCIVIHLSYIQGGSNMTGTVYTCLHTNQSRSYLNHLVHSVSIENTSGMSYMKIAKMCRNSLWGCFIIRNWRRTLHHHYCYHILLSIYVLPVFSRHWKLRKHGVNTDLGYASCSRVSLLPELAWCAHGIAGRDRPCFYPSNMATSTISE